MKPKNQLPRFRTSINHVEADYPAHSEKIQPTLNPGGGITSTAIEKFYAGSIQEPSGMLSTRPVLDFPNSVDHPITDRSWDVLNDLPTFGELELPPEDVPPED